MSNLAKIQRDFCQFVLGHGHRDFMQHMKSTESPQESSLNIYHNNVFSVHARALENDYPLIFSIMGPIAARTMAFAYVETSFPCTASLDEWGRGLVSFIQRYEPAGVWPYLEDIAQYEWAKHAAYCAPEEPLLAAEDMRKLTVPREEELNFRFQKSCQLLAFSHPLEDIISAHHQDPSQPLLVASGSSYALILKHQGIVMVYWLTPSLFAFVNRLKEGQDAEVAFAAAQVLDADFDVQEAFTFLLSNPILSR
jgi:hypothetical protein